MALADPIVIPFGAGDLTLPLVSRNGESATYRHINDDGSYTELLVIHTSGKRRRHVIRLSTAVVNEDPISETNVLATAAMTVTADIPLVGVPRANIVDGMGALFELLTADTSSVLSKIISGES